jgi:cystathionine gamma-synthase
MSTKISLETALIHDGIASGFSNPVVFPLIQSTTFNRKPNGELGEDIYARSSNPNRRLLENKLAILESGSESASFASGQAATLAIFHSFGPNSHFIIPDDIYFGTRLILEKLMGDWNVEFSIVDMCDISAVEKAIQNNTKLIWIESPSNPSLKITDISEIVNICKKNNIYSVCDNTWATPFFTKPLEMGVDIVMHSTTKYLGGHSDILGGATIWSENLNEKIAIKIREFQSIGGGVPSPNDCWLLNRSLATFFLRMEKHANNAMKLAEYLNSHLKIEKVFYPGLTSDPFHSLAKSQMKNGFGGMLSVLIRGDEANCLSVASKLKVFQHATSLGGVESLVDHRKSAEGIHSVSPGNLLRVSVGIENIDDLIEDFKQALS